MASLVADTHSIVWFLHGEVGLSVTARSAMRATVRSGDPIFVSSMSLVESTYLVEKRRWPESALRMLRVAPTDSSFGFKLVPLDLRVVDALEHVARNEVPDLPDRVIAATALALKLPLVTCDGKLRVANVQTIWYARTTIAPAIALQSAFRPPADARPAVPGSAPVMRPTRRASQ